MKTTKALFSRLTADHESRGVTLNGWLQATLQGRQWSLCFSSFTEGDHGRVDDAIGFHSQCDRYRRTLVVARNEFNYTFGGYAFAPRLILFLL